MTSTLPHGSIARAQQLVNRHRFLNPPRPPARTLAEDLAVARLDETPCHSGRVHLIPSTSTICLRCGTDARTLTREDTP